MSIAEDKLVKIREQVQHHLNRVAPAQLSNAESVALEQRIRDMLGTENAVIVAHYYTAPEIQALAEATGGCVSDSLEPILLWLYGRSNETAIITVLRFTCLCTTRPRILLSIK